MALYENRLGAMISKESKVVFFQWFKEVDETFDVLSKVIEL